MGAAAGAHIHAANFDEAQGWAITFWKFADSDGARLLGRDLVHEHLAVLPHEAVGIALGLLQLGAAEAGDIEVDGADFLARVKAEGGRIEELRKAAERTC